MTLLSLNNVSVVFQARTGLFSSVAIRALDGVSLELDSGETLAVVGESGSGKTTLGRVCLRLLKPTDGSIHFDEQDITTVQERRLKGFRKRAQGIFQDPFSSLDPYMTVGQIVEEPLTIHRLGQPDTRMTQVHEALDEVRLRPGSDFVSKFPHTLSGGQRQRVAIARALVLQPELVIADEPVSMVDASSRAEILYLMRDLQDNHNTAFVYITHDIATAYHFSQQIAVMYLGRVVESGPTRQVISNPLHPYTQALLQAVPEPDPSNRDRRRATLTGDPPSHASPPPGCHFHPRCPYALDRCRIEDPRLQEVRPGQQVACHLWNGPDPEARLPEKPATAE
jgi:peptide/nickel transport system ATP-binding protein